MAPRSRGIERALKTAVSPSTSLHVCRSCRQAISRRSYAVAATAQQPTEVPPLQAYDAVHPVTAESAQPTVIVKAGVVLSRPPLITADPHPFETAYHLYQRRLNERLVLPFTQYFYYKRGTPAFDDWRKRRTERGGVATRDIGKYNAYTKESWHDELLVEDDSASPQKILEQLVDEEGRASEFTPTGGNEKTAGLKRTTEADERSDQRSLERSLSRTLYLLVQMPESESRKEEWIFPTGLLHRGQEGLKEAAQRVLDESCGPNMNVWLVGNHPVGHLVQKPRKSIAATDNVKAVPNEAAPSVEQEDVPEKTFFMKGRIFAGNANVRQQTRIYQDFKWLSKEEIQEKVDPQYYRRVQDMLVAQ